MFIKNSQNYQSLLLHLILFINLEVKLKKLNRTVGQRTSTKPN